jgi:hypothetical protein
VDAKPPKQCSADISTGEATPHKIGCGGLEGIAMLRNAVLIAMIAGVWLGYVLASAVRPQQVEARTWPTSCSVPKAVGTLKTARADGWLFFEDSAGVVRAVDTDCKVKLTVNRE